MLILNVSTDTDNIFNLLSAKISALAIQYPLVVTTALLNFFLRLCLDTGHKRLYKIVFTD